MEFWYATTAPVPAEAQRAIFSDVGSIDRDWWGESIDLGRASNRPRILEGMTKVYRTDVPEKDDAFMRSRDVEFIIGVLARWSKTHDIAWRCGFHEESDECGIEGGRPDASAKRLLARLAREGGAGKSAERDDKRAAALLH
ncbi:MAG: hypothetical protein ACAI25_04685 [Planctomycetota bacterium]